MATTSIDLNSLFDTRDVLDRLNDLEADAPEYPEDADERDAMVRLLSELSDYFDESALLHGITIIPDDEFVAYAREYAYDLGAVDENANWPTMHIDWEAAATALQQDYTGFDFDGVTYWGRG